MTTSAAGINSPRLPSLISAPLVRQMLKHAKEWQARRAIRTSLAGLSGKQLQDLGLIRDDVDAACSFQLSRTADLALKASAAQRAGNW